MFVYMRNEYGNNGTLSNGETHIEDDNTISSDNNSFIKYNNIYYSFSNQTLDEEDIDSLIGSGKAVFYNSSQHKLTEMYDVYSIKNESAEEKIAVKIDNEYYIFTNDRAI